MLWRSRLDGSDRLQLTYPPLSAFFAQISPDGTRVAFNSQIAGHGYDVYTMSMSGGKLQKIASDAAAPFWSPDGTSLAFSAILPDPTIPATIELRILDLQSGAVKPIPGGMRRVAVGWPAADRLVASSNDGSQKVATFDFRSQKWSDLGGPCENIVPSLGGDYLYCETTETPYHKVVRVRLADGHRETVMAIRGLHRVVDPLEMTTLGIAPDGSVLLTRDVGTQEIYALTVKWP